MSEAADKANKLKGLSWIIGGLFLACLFVFGISPLVRIIPWSWEEKVAGMLPAPEACRSTPEAEALLHKLVTRIYPVEPGDEKFSVDVRVVREAEVNAFASLGGKIMLNTGLLAQARSPEEVAGVLAHEIEHVRHRHVLEGAVLRLVTAGGMQMIFSGDASDNDWINYFLTMGFSRSQEAEADEDGLRRLQAGRVDNTGFKNFFDRMEDAPGAAFISDHPSSRSRVDRAARFSNTGAKKIMNQEDWLVFKKYCR